MRFNLAWANTAAQNVSFKIALMALVTICIVLTLSTARLALRNPIIIDRACFSAVIEGSSTEHSTTEIETFVREAIRQRFNSDANSIPNYLSLEEEGARAQEQKELSTRGMSQNVLVRSVKSNGKMSNIDADRIISVAQVRSAFSFPLTVTLGSTTRTQNNPYGLQIVKIIPVKMEEK